MGCSAGTVWEPRITGDNAQNGSGFDPAYGGVDYSQQDSPFHTYTDLVLAAMAAPSAPSVADLPTGGTYAAGTYYVTITWYNSDGNHETVISSETPVTVVNNGRVQVTSPASIGGADKYRVYVSTVSGSGHRLQTANFITDIPIGIDAIITSHNVGGAVPPGATTLFNQVSSASRPFVNNDKGNIFYLTSGVNWSTGRYQIQNVVGGVATVDRRAGTTVGASGGNARLGGGASGGLPSLTQAGGPKGGNTVWLKTGWTVPLGSTGWSASFNGTAGFPIRIEGYSVTRGDGERAVIAHNSNSTNIVSLGGSWLHILNLEIYGAGASTGTIGWNATIANSVIENVIARDNKNPVQATNGNNVWLRCWFKNGGDTCILFPGSGGTIQQNYMLYCVAENAGAGGSGVGAGINTGDGGIYVSNCIIKGNIFGIRHDNARFQTHIVQNTIDDNTTGIRIGNTSLTLSANTDAYGSISFRQNIFSRNTTAIQNDTGHALGVNYQKFKYSCNAFWDNTTKYVNLSSAPDDLDLTVSPYMDESSGDYTLNNEPGGGASIRAMTCPGTFSDGINLISGSVGFGGVATVAAAEEAIQAFEEIQLPTEISRGAKGGPGFRTIVVTTTGGSEQRIALWNEPLYRWDVAFGARTVTQAQTLLNFFVGRMGKATGFRFKDWNDYEIETAELAVQLTSTTYQIVKRYTSGAVTWIREIKKPVSATVKVWNGGVEVVGGWSVDAATGIITFTGVPGYNPGVTCEFDVPVRFDTDVMDMVQTDVAVRDWEGVPVVELRY